MELKAKVLVVGGGAIGGLFAWRLSLCRNVIVSVVCRSNYQAVAEHGYLINSAQFGTAIYRPKGLYKSVSEAAMYGGPFDYVIVALKALPNIYDSSEVIAPAVSDSTMVVLFQNGISIEDPYVKRFPTTPIASSVSFISVKQTAPGELRHGGFSLLAAGMHNKPTPSNTDKLRFLLDAFESQGVSSLFETDIQPYRWQKHILNGSTNPVSVVCGGSSCQEMVNNDYCCKLLEELMAEIFVLGKKVTGKSFPGVDGIVDPQTATDYIKSIPVPVYTSMLVDSQCKRPMERDVILKNPIELAEKHGVDVPHMKALYALLTMIEEGYSK
ncbi:2-dehydropantoate 2-reductase [Martensiomyces pterosporus]|nr:2-dehydropantoate 2-reductase [Martensiomyces pterosporus]